MHLPLLAVLLAASPGPRPLVAQAAIEPPPEAPAPFATAATEDKPLPFDTSEPKAEEKPRLRLLGLSLGAGVPDGVVLSAVVRPVKWVRASAGLAHNALALGVQGSVTVVPFHWAVTPTFQFTAGKFFDADVTKYVDDGDVPAAFLPPLEDFSYSFYSAQLGLEFGSQDGFTFFLRGGLAWVRSDLAGVRYQADGTSTTIDVSNLDVSVTTPTVNLGFAYYFW
jgi:hypothetical protein